MVGTPYIRVVGSGPLHLELLGRSCLRLGCFPHTNIDRPLMWSKGGRLRFPDALHSTLPLVHRRALHVVYQHMVRRLRRKAQQQCNGFAHRAALLPGVANTSPLKMLSTPHGSPERQDTIHQIWYRYIISSASVHRAPSDRVRPPQLALMLWWRKPLAAVARDDTLQTAKNMTQQAKCGNACSPACVHLLVREQAFTCVNPGGNG